MDITLFCVLLSLSFALITLGLFRQEHTELSLIGFVFLFLLSMIIINGQLEYKTGQYLNTTFTYEPIGGIYYVNASYETQLDIYSPANMTGLLSHSVGYWLAICSVIGFLGVLLSLRKAPEIGGGRQNDI